MRWMDSLVGSAAIGAPLSARSIRRALFDRARDFLRVGMLAQLLHFGIVVRWNLRRIAPQLIEHADELRRAPLVEQVDLQIELVARRVDLRDAVRGGQDE